MKKKFNWWVILAILVIGIPVGYVATGVIKNLADRESSVVNGDSVTKQKVEPTDSIRTKKDTTEVQKQKEPEKEPDAVGGKVADNPAAKKQKEVVEQQQKERKPQIKTEEQLRMEADRAEQRRLQREEQQRIKEANAEKMRLQREEQARLKKEKAEQLRIEKERKAEEARQKKAEENRRKAELAEQKKREAEAIAQQKKNELRAEVQKIVASGRKSSKVSDGCTIVVNGRNTTDYQAFRMGVNYKAYSNVTVNSVSTDSKGNITRIAVSATESKDAN